MIDVASLVAAGIGPTQARLFETPLRAVCERFGIDTPARQAAFVAQCAHESALFTRLEEGLYYRTAERICAIFRGTVPDPASAAGLACNPKALANRVYANRNGNRDEASGDGWRYRGRGLIQLTGRTNYTRAAQALGRDYVGEPDRVLDPFDACLTAGWFWDSAKLSALADAGRIDDITRAVNGRAMAGAGERRELYARALAAFATPAPSPASGATRRVPTPARIPHVALTTRADIASTALSPAAREALSAKSSAGLSADAMAALSAPRAPMRPGRRSLPAGTARRDQELPPSSGEETSTTPAARRKKSATSPARRKRSTAPASQAGGRRKAVDAPTVPHHPAGSAKAGSGDRARAPKKPAERRPRPR
jgi:putative chitinase